MEHSNQTTPKVSVVIPIYNTEKYLHQCLNSLLNQTLKDIEIICVDDGSTDKSCTIIKNYNQADSRITLHTQSHLGAAEARNAGIELSQGKYLMFVDSDDYFEPTFLQELFEKAEENCADLVVCSAKKLDQNDIIDPNTNDYWPINLKKTPIHTPFCPADFYNNLFEMFGVEPWNKLYDAELIKTNYLRFDALDSCNDVTFSYLSRIFAKKIYVSDKKLVNYRAKRPQSITTNRGEKACNIILCAVKIKNFLKEKGLWYLLKDTYTRAFVSHFRYELTKTNDEQYNNFVSTLEKLMPNCLNDFEFALKKDKITVDTLNKVIGNKKVFLWGASLFLEKILEFEAEKNENILGIIDKNPQKEGSFLGNYKIYSPKVLESTQPEGILLTVFFNNEAIYKELKENYPKQNILPNIFSGGYDA